ncbi:hypothetical protein D3C74_261430 [compost metagenome]
MSQAVGTGVQFPIGQAFCTHHDRYPLKITFRLLFEQVVKRAFLRVCCSRIVKGAQQLSNLCLRQ